MSQTQTEETDSSLEINDNYARILDGCTEPQHETKEDSGMMAALSDIWMLEQMGCEVDIKMPFEFEVIAEIDGIRYSIRQNATYTTIDGESCQATNTYTLGMDIDGEHVTPNNPNNSVQTMSVAFWILIQMIEYDPRVMTKPIA